MSQSKQIMPFGITPGGFLIINDTLTAGL